MTPSLESTKKLIENLLMAFQKDLSMLQSGAFKGNSTLNGDNLLTLDKMDQALERLALLEDMFKEGRDCKTKTVCIRGHTFLNTVRSRSMDG